MASKQGASSGEKIIDVKRVVREEKPVQRINFYAALGIAILTVLLLAGFSFFVLVTSGGLSYEFQQMTSQSGMLAALALFFTLPVLIANKYGWRTVVTTILVQSLLIFFVTVILSLVVSNGDQPDPYGYDDTVLRGDIEF